MIKNEPFMLSPNKYHIKFNYFCWVTSSIAFELPAILYDFSEIFKCFVKKYNFFSHRNVYSKTQPKRKPIPSHILIKRGV
jgi:hypothetical protein